MGNEPEKEVIDPMGELPFEPSKGEKVPWMLLVAEDATRGEIGCAGSLEGGRLPGKGDAIERAGSSVTPSARSFSSLR